MKNLITLALLVFSLGTALSADIKNLILPGSAFGAGWELTQPNIIGASAAPNYINRSLPNSPMVSIQIISLPSKENAKERLERKMESAGYKGHVKKVSGDPLSYEQDADGLKRRYVLIKNYWLTVDQVGEGDDRVDFIKKYTEHIQKNG